MFNLIKGFVLLLIFSAVSLGIIAQNKHDQEPVKVILVLTDGMGFLHLQAAMTASKGGLNMAQMPYTGMMTTLTVDEKAPDAYAATTAIATGVKTREGYAGVDAEGQSHPTLLELAKRNNMMTGLITTGSLTDPGNSPFYAHFNRNLPSDFVAERLLDADIDILIGGGQRFFIGDAQPSILARFAEKGYKTITKERKLGRVRNDKLLAVVANTKLPYHSEGRENYFFNAWRSTFRSVIKSGSGYFVVISNPLISRAAQSRDIQNVTSEIIAIDALIGELMNLARAEKNVLVIVTGSYETGGLFLETVENNKPVPSWRISGNTVGMVPVFAIGKGAKNFTGLYSNDMLFEKLKTLMNADQ